jgi:hypothetical protein
VIGTSLLELYDTLRLVRATDRAINPDVTIVTGYVHIPDVPPDTEHAFRRRTRQQYLDWMRATLSIRANTMVFVEPETVDVVAEARRELAEHTAVRTVSADDLRRSDEHREAARIIAGGYMRHATRPNRIELKVPLYTTIMFSKFDWVRAAIESNPFGTRYFLWVDAGLGHGLDHRIRYRSVIGRVWPSASKNSRMAGTVLVLATGLHVRHLDPVEMMTSHNHVIAGTVWGGDKDMLLQFCDNLLDDEQSVMSRVFLKHPELCTVVDCSGRLRDRCYFLKYLDAR